MAKEKMNAAKQATSVERASEKKATKELAALKKKLVNVNEEMTKHQQHLSTLKIAQEKRKKTFKDEGLKDAKCIAAWNKDREAEVKKFYARGAETKETCFKCLKAFNPRKKLKGSNTDYCVSCDLCSAWYCATCVKGSLPATQRYICQPCQSVSYMDQKSLDNDCFDYMQQILIERVDSESETE